MKKEKSFSSEIQLSVREFEKVLPKICDAEISYIPERWTPENPLYGTCVPVTVVANKVFGGNLLCAELKPYPEFKHMGWHWANELPGGRLKDFTRAQFGRNYPEGMQFTPRTAYSVLRRENVRVRTDILFRRLLREIS